PPVLQRCLRVVTLAIAVRPLRGRAIHTRHAAEHVIERPVLEGEQNDVLDLGERVRHPSVMFAFPTATPPEKRCRAATITGLAGAVEIKRGRHPYSVGRRRGMCQQPKARTRTIDERSSSLRVALAAAMRWPSTSWCAAFIGPSFASAGDCSDPRTPRTSRRTPSCGLSFTSSGSIRSGRFCRGSSPSLAGFVSMCCGGDGR